MFATFRYSSQEESLQVEHSPSPTNRNGHYRSACDNCRARKLRCDGQREGCERCRDRRVSCDYSEGRLDGKRRRKDQVAGLMMENPTSDGQDSSFKDLPSHMPIQNPPPSDSTESMELSSPSVANLMDMTPFDIMSLDLFINSSPDERSSLENGSIRTTSTTDSHRIIGLSPALTPAVLSHQTHKSNPADNGLSVHVDTYQSTTHLTPHQPTTHQSATHSPTAHQPTAHQPTAHQPTAHQPTAHQPTAHQPTAHQPTAHQPTAHQPTAHQPTAHQQSSIEHCHCVDDALQVIEKIEGITRQVTPLIPDYALVVQRTAMDYCSRIMECGVCSMISRNIMLALVVCEKLAVLLHGTLLPGGWRKSIQSQLHGHYPAVLRYPKRTEESVILGSYRSSDQKEWAAVVTLLFTFQEHRLQKLIGDLKHLAASNHWHVHVSMLELMEKGSALPQTIGTS
ncbi:C6 zinc finger domain-containing protein [Penicillium solitum]|uniref:C6 zinc finger domain-containing protein n=1 Tax=Penicillium solitum TaxID=60172 RepID=UPI0032C43F87|nr:C6 zinc finger domain-containing protein [Penicillium solitum]